MFNTLMWYLNIIRLASIAQFLRFTLAHVLPVTEEDYDAELVGYRGYVKAPGVGVVAFRRNDGSLTYKW